MEPYQGIRIGINDGDIAKTREDFAKLIEELKKQAENPINFKANTVGIKDELKQTVATVNELVQAYKKLGDVKVKPLSYDSDGNLQKFKLTIQQTNGILDQLIYRMDKIESNGQLIPSGYFDLKGIKELDNSKKVLQDIESLQKQVYSQLNSLQKEEFNNKQKLIDAENAEKKILEDRLSLIKQQQNELSKLLNISNLKDNNRNNDILIQRKKLTEDLIIAQEKYNKQIQEQSKNNAYREVEQNLNKIYTLQNQSLRVGEEEKKAIQAEITVLENKNKELSKQLEIQQLIKLNEKEETNLNRFDGKVSDLKENAAYKESQQIIKEIYNTKKQILETDKNDVATINTLNSKLNELKSKQNNSLNNVKSSNGINDLKQQEINYDKELELLKKQRQQKVDQYDNNLGEKVQTKTPFDFSANTDTINKYVKEIAGANAEWSKAIPKQDQFGRNIIEISARTKEGADKWHNYSIVMNEAEKTITKVDKGLSNVGQTSLSLGEKFKNLMSGIASWSIGMTAFYGTIRQLREGLDFVNDLNKIQTNIQIIGDYSPEQIKNLTQAYSDLAGQLHTTTKETMGSAEEFLRAGHDVEESKNLIKASVIGGKISGQNSKDVADQLIAISNGYKMNTKDAKEMMNVVDQISTADNKSATSFKEIAGAMKECSNSAQNAKVDFTHLVAYISTVSSVTRKSESDIGNSFKAQFARYENVKGGQKFDAENDDLSNVERDLRKYADVKLRSDSGTFKSYETVIDELKNKWSSLNEVSKAAISKAMAGTNHWEDFAVLMGNMDKVDGMLGQLGKSAGSSEEKFNEASKQTESKINDVKHSLENLYSTMIKSETVNASLDVINNFIKALGKIGTMSTSSIVEIGALSAATILLIKNFKALTLVIMENGSISSLFSAAFNKLFGSMITGATATEVLTGAFAALRGALSALFLTPAGLLFTGLTTVIGIASYAVVEHVKHQADLQKETEDLTTSYKSLTEAMAANNVEGMKSASVEAKKEQGNLQNLLSNQKKAKEELDKASSKYDSSPTQGNENALIKAQAAYDNATKALKEQEEVVKKSGYTFDETTGKFKELAQAESDIKIDTAIEKVKQSIEKRKQEDSSLSDLIDKYNNLNNVGNKTKAQQMEMSNIATTLHNKYSDLTVSVDKNGNSIITNTNLLGTKKQALAEDIQAITKDADAQVMEGLKAEKVQVGNTEMTIDEIQKRITAYREEAEAANGGQGSEYVDAKQMQMIQVYDGIQDKLKALKQSVTDTSGEVANNYTPSLEDNASKTKEDNAAQKALESTIKEVKNEMKSYENQIKAVDNALYGLDSQIQGMDETSDDYINALKQQNEMFNQRIDLVNGATNANNQYMSSIAGMSGLTGSALGEQVVQAAESYLGTPYKYGGKDSSGIDCSGLVAAAYKQIGVDLSGSTYTQIQQGSAVSKDQLQAGDLVFFGTSDNPHHVGMYVGSGNFIEAPHTGSQVRISSLANRSDYLTARRMIQSDSYSSSSGAGGNVVSSAGGQVGGFSDTNSFIQAALPLANAIYQKYNILPSVTLAQAIEESGGTSKEAKEDNNYFGMTWTSGSGKQKGNARPEGGNYVKYNNLGESLTDYAKLLEKWGIGGQSFEEALNTLTQHGYAADGNYANEVASVAKSYGLSKYDNGTTGGIANLSDTGLSEIESILSKNEDYAKQNIDYQRKIYENNTKIYEAYKNRYDKESSDVDKQLNLDKENYTYFEKDNNRSNDSSRQYMQKEYEDINTKNNILLQKQEFIENELKDNSGKYDAKTVAEMNEDLTTVQVDIKKNLNDLHQAFKDFLSDRLEYNTQGYKDLIDQYSAQLNLLNEQDSAGSQAKVALNEQILEQERNKTEAIKEQIQYVQKLYINEQFGVTRDLWANQLKDLQKTLIENEDEVQKTINTLRDANITQILDDTDKRLKLVNDDLKNIDRSSKDVGDNNTSQKLINAMNQAQDYITQLKEYTKAYNDIYNEVSKDGIISSDDQKKIDDARSKIDGVNDALQTTGLTINSLKLENAIAPFSQTIDKITNQFGKLDFELNMLSSTNYTDKTNILSNQLGLNDTKISSLMDEYKNLSNQSATPGTKEAEALTTNLTNVRDKLIEAAKEGKTLKSEMADAQLSALFEQVSKPQGKINQLTSNIDFETSMSTNGSTNGLLLGGKYLDTTESDSKKELEETKGISNAVDNINNQIANLQAGIYDIDSSNISNTIESTTSKTNELLKNINDNITKINEANNKTVTTKNVYGTGDDLKNAQFIAEKYGIDKLFNFINTSDNDFRWSEHKLTLNDVAVGGTGAGVPGYVQLNGADRVAGLDRTGTKNAIDDYMKSIADLLKKSSSDPVDSSNQKTNEQLLSQLGVSNTTTSTIAGNTGNNVEVTNVQTTTLVKSEEDVANSVNNNINSNFITIEELTRNVKDTLTTIKDAISSLKELEDKDLGQIITNMKTIDTKTIIQELINLHGSVNNLGTLIGSINSVNFNPIQSVTMPDYNKEDKKPVDKKANGGGTDGSAIIVGDGEGENAGYELAVLPNGRIIKVGENGFELIKPPEGTQIISHTDSKKILNQGGIRDISKYAKGTKYRIFAKDVPAENGVSGDFDYAMSVIGSTRDDITITKFRNPDQVTLEDYVMGGTGVIPSGYNIDESHRIGGKDRAETHLLLDNWLKNHPKVADTNDIQTVDNPTTIPDTVTPKKTSDYNQVSGEVPSSSSSNAGIIADTDTRKAINGDISNLQSQYTNEINDGTSTVNLLKQKIELEGKSVELNNDALKQLKDQETIYKDQPDELKKVTDQEKNYVSELQNSEKEIADLAKQTADAATAKQDAENKNLENDIKLIGSTSTKDELENDKRKLEILKDQSQELENQKDALKDVAIQQAFSERELKEFNSSNLSSDENSQLKELLLKQAKNGYLDTNDQIVLDKLENKLSSIDKTTLYQITELLKDIYNKKTDVQVDIQNKTDANADSEYDTAQQIIQNKKSLDEAQLEQLKKDKAKEYFNVTPDEFNQYKTNESARIQEKLKESQDLLNTDPNNLYYQDEVLAKTKELSNIQGENYANIKDWEDEFTKIHQANADALEEENQLEEEKEQRLQNQNDLLSLQKQLVDALDQKNVREMVKDKNGNWQYQYVADQTKVDDLNKQINDKMKDNDKWEEEQKINKEKEYENDLINIQKNAYDKLIKDQEDILNDKYKDMNYLTEEYLQKIKDQCNGNDKLVQQALGIALQNSQKDLTGFITTTDGKVVEMHDLIQTLVDEIIKDLNSINDDKNKVDANGTITTPSIYGGMVTNKESDVNSYINSPEYRSLQNQAVNATLNGDTNTLSNIHNQAVTLADKYGVKLDTGGYTGDWGTKEGKLAWLHQKELVLKEEDTKNVLATVKYADNLNKNLLDKFNLKDFELKTVVPKINVQMPSNIVTKNNNESKPIQQQVTIQASFPNVKDRNEIEKAFEQIEGQTIQYLRE